MDAPWDIETLTDYTTPYSGSFTSEVVEWDGGKGDSDPFAMYCNLDNSSNTPGPAILSPQSDDTPSESAGSTTIQEGAGAKDQSGAALCAKHKEQSSSQRQRRKAQNRISQRNFRERRENYTKSLEIQVSELYEKHQRLLQSYSAIADKALKLEIHMQALNSEVEALRSLRPTEDHLLPDAPTTEKSDNLTEFDAYSVAAAQTRDVHKELGDAMSEFLKLRTQLAEAEERIKKLERDSDAGRSRP